MVTSLIFARIATGELLLFFAAFTDIAAASADFFASSADIAAAPADASAAYADASADASASFTFTVFAAFFQLLS